MTIIAPPAPPPVGPPPQLTPRGRRAVRVLLVAAAAVVALSVGVTLGVLSWGLSTFRVVTDAQSLPAGMRSLVIDTGAVPVAVRITADRRATEPRVNLRLVNSTRAADHPLSVSNDAVGTHIGISAESSPILEWARGGEITVTLPPELARELSVTTRQQSGDVTAQTDLDQLVARTVHGDIRLNGAARRVETHTDSGDVTIHASVRESFQASTIHGDIVVDFTNAAPRTVDAVSRHGDVMLALPGDGPFLVHAQSGGSTSVRVPQTSDPGQAVAQVNASTDNGDVTVEGNH